MSMKNISVIGIGKLGICFSLTLEKAGYNVLGIDINQEHVDKINSKTLNSDEEGVEELLRSCKNFKASTSIKEALRFSDLIFVIVATPSLDNGRYDHSQVDSIIEEVKSHGTVNNKHFVVCCTVMPGYCEKVTEEISQYGYTVSYNPEFIAQGTIIKDQLNPDIILIGEGTKEAGDSLQGIYENITKSEPRFNRMSCTEAEITKIALNCFLTTKISYANMVGDIVKSYDGDPKVVLKAIGDDSRIGSKYLGYGYGYGGPCFPRDNRAFALCAKDKDMSALISVASDEVNDRHLDFQIEEFVQNNDNNEQVVFECVTYKPESIMIVESQQLAFAAGVARRGFNVKIRERKAVIRSVLEKYGDLFEYEER